MRKRDVRMDKEYRDFYKRYAENRKKEDCLKTPRAPFLEGYNVQLKQQRRSTQDEEHASLKMEAAIRKDEKCLRCGCHQQKELHC